MVFMKIPTDFINVYPVINHAELVQDNTHVLLVIKFLIELTMPLNVLVNLVTIQILISIVLLVLISVLNVKF